MLPWGLEEEKIQYLLINSLDYSIAMRHKSLWGGHGKIVPSPPNKKERNVCTFAYYKPIYIVNFWQSCYLGY